MAKMEDGGLYVYGDREPVYLLPTDSPKFYMKINSDGNLIFTNGTASIRLRTSNWSPLAVAVAVMEVAG